MNVSGTAHPRNQLSEENSTANQQSGYENTEN